MPERILGAFTNDLTFASHDFQVPLSEYNLMKEIYNYDSVQAMFTLFSDLLYYKSGVYIHKKGFIIGLHSVKIIGWGVEKGVNYWLCVNSWNDQWGDK